MKKRRPEGRLIRGPLAELAMTLFRRENPLSILETNLLREKVLHTLKDKSFLLAPPGEEFTLASGKKSKYYLDLKPALFDPQGAKDVAELVMTQIENIWVDYIGGLAVGAVPMVAAITLLSLHFKCPLPGFFVRKKVKDHGTKYLVEGVPLGQTLEGKRVIIVDDVTTEGRSAMHAVEAARDAGAEIVLVLSIVDREEGAEEFFRSQSLPFKCLFRAREFFDPQTS
jgi:orotate phosphoribosyltransferase